MSTDLNPSFVDLRNRNKSGKPKVKDSMGQKTQPEAEADLIKELSETVTWDRDPKHMPDVEDDDDEEE